jgi:serine/threonine-protein kinase
MSNVVRWLSQPTLERQGTVQPPADLVLHVLDDQQTRWRSGQPLIVEAYLKQYPALADDAEAVVDLIYNETLLYKAAGGAPRLEDYLRRFPQYEIALRDQFEMQELMERGRFLDPLQTWGEDERSLPDHDIPLSSRGVPVIPGYEVLDRLGEGGMGVVYQAIHLRLNRVVALKVMSDSALAQPGQRLRFRIEAEAIARLQHPNILQIHEVGDYQGRPYLALEYLNGGSLDRRLARSPQPPPVAAHLVETLARAISYAHQRGIVHRDLKPSNILLHHAHAAPHEEGPYPILKIADFGLARLLEEEDSSPESGAPLGTASYMSPEQARGQAAICGPASDIYGLGAILYQMLTGRPPFEGESQREILRQVVEEEPTPPRLWQPRTPHALEAICLKCLAKEPGQRYLSASALAEDLRCFLAGEQVQARPQGALLRWVKRQPVLAAWVGVCGAAILSLLTFSLGCNIHLRHVNAELNAALQSAGATRGSTDDKARQVLQVLEELFHP